MAGQPRSTVSIRLTGASRNDPLPRLLRSAFGLKERRARLEKIVKDAGKPMAADMAAGAPVDTGRLRASFGVQKSKKSNFNTISYFVGARKGRTTFGGQVGRFAGWRAHWAELGTKHHSGAFFIQPAIRKNIPVAIQRIRNGVANLVREARRKT